MSYNKEELIRKGKLLAYLLRHDKVAFDNGLIDKNGWRRVDELIEKYGYTYQMLEAITATNNKKRYAFSLDKLLIRARQGHSIPVDVGLTEASPPEILYHGTSLAAYISHISKEGIKPMSRQFVHLSADYNTAVTVGKRHGGNPYVIKIDTCRMLENNYKFWLSENGVWLTKAVPTGYFI